MVICVSERFLLSCAHIIRNGVILCSFEIMHFRHWVGNVLSILDVEPLDLNNISVISPVFGNKLSDNGHWAAGVNSLVLTKESFLSNTVWAKVTAILVAEAFESIVSIATLNFGIARNTTFIDITWVRCYLG